MSINYPSAIDVFTNPSGTSTLDSPDHALQHSDANDAIEAIEAVIGTTAGTSVLKDFSAGEFPARVNSGGTLTQTLTGGTINATTLGTPTVTGGSFASPTTTGTDAGTATLTNKTLTSPKINENVALTSTSTELNQLDGVEIGGTSSGDVVTIDDTQTLSNKTISDNLIIAGGLRTFYGTTSCPNNTATTTYTFADGVGFFFVSVWLPDTAVANYYAYAIIATDIAGSGAARILQQTDGSSTYITLSGLALQVRQTSGGTQQMRTSILKIV
jgi:hypothetical protein